LYIDTNTLQVGIGTTRPQQAFHVQGNILSTGTLTASNLSILGDFVTLNTVTSNTEQVVVTNAGTGPALKVTQTGANSIAEFYDDGNVLALKIADGGNVGIGTANPQAKLHVQGDVNITGPVALVMGATGIKTYVIKEYNSSASSRWWLLATLSNSSTNLFNMNGNFSRVDDYYYISLKINANNTRVPIISSSQQVGINQLYVSKCQIYRNTSTEVLDVWISVPSYTIVNMLFDSNGTINTVASWTVTSPVVSATYVLLHDTSINANQTVTSNGNVGIGRTNPQAMLHVNGNIIGGALNCSQTIIVGSLKTKTTAGGVGEVIDGVRVSVPNSYQQCSVFVHGFGRNQDGGGLSSSYIGMFTIWRNLNDNCYIVRNDLLANSYYDVTTRIEGAATGSQYVYFRHWFGGYGGMGPGSTYSSYTWTFNQGNYLTLSDVVLV